MAPNSTAPIIIVAPATRCGTTLLQRAFNSTGQAIIYGENFNLVENYPGIIGMVFRNVPLRKERTAEVRQQVLSGDYDIDASPMFPDYEGYAEINRQNFYRLISYYEERSRSYGRTVWGIKHQIRVLDGFSVFMRLLPQARYVFIYRNVFEIAPSHKARFSPGYPHPKDFADLGRTWSRNLRAMRAVKQPNVLHLEYAELAGNPEGAIALLESHCRIGGIRREVFSRRINVSPLIDRLDQAEAETSYRTPKPLEPHEEGELLQAAREACEEFGYAIPRR